MNIFMMDDSNFTNAIFLFMLFLLRPYISFDYSDSLYVETSRE